MNKIRLRKAMSFSITASLLSAIVLFSACSHSSEANPIVGVISEDKIPAEPKLVHAAITESLDNVKTGAPVKSFTGIDGETLSVESAVNVIEPDPETQSNYVFVYDNSYLSYNTPVYEIESEGLGVTLDTDETTKKYNEYLNSKKKVYTVKRGDKLENGLICTDANTSYYYNDDGSVSLLDTQACFSGELTLTGTVRCTQDDDPIVGKGDLTFYPDAGNGNIISRYETNLPESVDINSSGILYEKFRFGNISDLAEEYASMIGDNECINVQVTLKDIHISLSNGQTDLGSFAVVADMKVI